MQATITSSEILGTDILKIEILPVKTLRFTPGQFIELSLPSAVGSGRDSRHWFTVASAPHEKMITIMTRLRDPLSIYKQILSALPSGDLVTISDALGDFVLPKDPSLPLLLIAGGVGITPFLSMAKQSKYDNKIIPAHLIHIASETYDFNLFKSLEPWVVKTSYIDKNIAGNDLEMIASYCEPNQFIYISGSETFVKTAAKVAKSRGVHDNHIISDSFLGY